MEKEATEIELATIRADIGKLKVTTGRLAATRYLSGEDERK
jgi:hypothetical protein